MKLSNADAAEIILVIEDDVHIGGLVGQVLTEAGYNAEIVRDVGAARALAAQGLRPAAMLSDLMIAGSSGPEHLRDEIETIFPGVPLTLMTGVPPKRRALLGVDDDHILEKPFELEALLAAVRAMVAGA
ncbi:MAG TPA: response regulator [Polyangia bacterium]|jgi:two-component system response regulator MprA